MKCNSSATVLFPESYLIQSSDIKLTDADNISSKDFSLSDIIINLNI